MINNALATKYLERLNRMVEDYEAEHQKNKDFYRYQCPAPPDAMIRVIDVIGALTAIIASEQPLVIDGDAFAKYFTRKPKWPRQHKSPYRFN